MLYKACEKAMFPWYFCGNASTRLVNSRTFAPPVVTFIFIFASFIVISHPPARNAYKNYQIGFYFDMMQY